jgi:hypothetical protein
MRVTIYVNRSDGEQLHSIRDFEVCPRVNEFVVLDVSSQYLPKVAVFKVEHVKHVISKDVHELVGVSIYLRWLYDGEN